MPQAATQQQRTPKAPDQVLRIGPIRLAVWHNQTQQDGRNVTQHSIRITRRYKDKNGTWQTTESFFAEDLPKISILAQKAYEQIAVADNYSDDSVPV